MSTSPTSIHACIGNLMYMAPESFLHQHYDEASDMYSMGIVLNEMFSGVPPYKGLNVSPALAASKAANEG